MSTQTLRLAALFSDHAVVQQGQTVAVWGWMKPKSRVRVCLGATVAQNLSGADGKFLVHLPRMAAGGPFELKVESIDDGESITRKDIYVGEVWLASGQSNMEWTHMQVCGEADTGALACDGVRMFSTPRRSFAGRQSDVDAVWERGDDDTAVGIFSAVAYFFAKRLHKELGVKIGIINSSWGGTIVEAWTSRETLINNPDVAPWVLSLDNTVNDPEFWAPHEDVDLTDPIARQGLPADVSVNFPEDPGNNAFAEGWADAKCDMSDWSQMRLPGVWNNKHPFSGIFWFRMEVEIPSNWQGKDILLCIGAVDKQDTTYFNGVQVGKTGARFEQNFWNVPRKYTVPANLVKTGKNVIAVRAYSFAYHGGLIGPKNTMFIVPKEAADDKTQRIPLAGNWDYRIEHNLGVVATGNAGAHPGPGVANTPGILYDNMIAPLVPYSMKGAIWYQGESNASENFRIDSKKYERGIVDMIRDWRFSWAQGAFPFIQVQLANYQNALDFDENSTWANLRESQRRSLSEPNTGMAVIIDAGEAGNIHPADKETVGFRLAQWALAETYRKNIVATGPLYEGCQIDGNTMRIKFKNVGGGLVSKDGALKTFYIAGCDQTFEPAKAVIDGNEVVLSNPNVSEPMAARYAWADNPEGCNLYNAEGLPASPFRTDTW